MNIDNDENITKNESSTTTPTIDSNDSNNTIVEPISTVLRPNNNQNLKENFVKGIKWSPDGTCLLSSSEDKYMNLYELGSITPQNDSKNIYSLNKIFNVKEYDTIYDFVWYPFMNSNLPETCLFATSCRNSAIRLYSAFNGGLIGSYVPWKDVDDIESAICIQFSNDGKKIYSGFKKSIKIFDIERTGAEYIEFGTFIKKAKNQSKQDYFPGLPGIISCISFDRSNQSEFYAVSTYNGNIGLFDRDDNLVDIVPYPKNLPLRGITQLEFSPDGTHLFAGYRKSEYIVGWDLRNTTAIETYHLHRMMDSNQCYQFDFDKSNGGRHLYTGTQDGHLLSYDLYPVESKSVITTSTSSKLVQNQTLSTDQCVNSVACHPYLPIIATSFGERLFSLDTEFTITNVNKDFIPSISLYNNNISFNQEKHVLFENNINNIGTNENNNSNSNINDNINNNIDNNNVNNNDNNNVNNINNDNNIYIMETDNTQEQVSMILEN